MFVQAHVPVRLYRRDAPFLDLEADRIQRPHAGALDLFVLLPPAVVPSGEVRVVVDLQCNPDGCVQPFQVVELLVFHQRVDRPVDEFDGSLHEGLVAGAPDAGGERRTVVVLRESREVLVQLRLVLVRMRHGGLEVVRHDGLRRSAIEVEGILAGVDEVLLLLAHHRLDISELGAGKDGDEHLYGDLIAALPVHEVQPVSGEVHIHPVPGLVLQVGDGCGLDEVHLEDPEELAFHIAVRILLPVPLVDHSLRHALLPQHPGVFRHQVHKLHIPGRLRLGRVGGRLLVEQAEEFRLVHSHDLLDGLSAQVECADVLFHGVP